MYLTWRQRLVQEPQWRNFSCWPLVDTERWTPDKRRRFLRNQSIAAMAFAGKSFSSIANTYGSSKSSVSKLLERCLAGNDNEQPALSHGIIPNIRLTPNQRREPLRLFNT